jgi:serine/threonine-protein kinase
MPGLPLVLVLLGASYGAVLYPGLHTPKPAEPAALAPADDDLQKYFDTIPEQEKLATSYARAQYLQAPAVDQSKNPPHLVEGNPGAPVKIVEWTDIKCPHCARLLHDLDDISHAPGAAYSLEPRYFPLDGECNPGMTQTAGDGVRCLGAKIQICLENSPNFKQAQLNLFDNQASLTPALMMQIAERAMPQAELEQCIASPATTQRLQEDILYAMATRPEGTPIVLLNGKPALAVRSFIYGMVMSKGDPNAKLFASLPPPPTP